jgi:hypothetical protein
VRHTQEFDADAGARTVEEWLKAVAAVRPGSRLRDKMALQAAIYTIAATPAARRSQFAAEIQRRRRARHGPTGTVKPPVIRRPHSQGLP